MTSPRRLPFLCLLVWTLVPAAPAGAQCIVPPMSYHAETAVRAPEHILAADLGHDDAAEVIAGSASGIYVGWNDGGELAFTRVSSSASRGPIAVGDFTNDTHIDIAFASDTSLVVLPGNGDRTFSTPITTASGITPHGLVVAHVDAGPSIDLLTLDTSLSRLVAFANNGSGSFTETSRTQIDAYAYRVFASDLDADGWTDAIVTHHHSTVGVYFGSANGTLIRAIHIQEIVRAANIVRKAAGMTPMPVPAGAITAASILAIRNGINDARVALGAYAYPFTGDVAPGKAIAASHFRELREAVR